MITGLLGKKIGMTQIFDGEGNVVPVTVVEAGPCTILELRESPLKVKLGFESVEEKSLNKPEGGFFKKIGVNPHRVIREFNSSDNKEYKVGQQLKADFFRPGDFVDVTGRSLGKGFQGGMKRWNWSGGKASHGSMHHRRIGSNCSSAQPSRTFVGKHMPGHMGARIVTIPGLRVMDVDVDHNLILIKGAVPGHKSSIISIYRSHKRAFKSLEEKKAVVEHKQNPMKQSKSKIKGKGK